jgi:hypothetical protein
MGDTVETIQGQQTDLTMFLLDQLGVDPVKAASAK